ncbi:MAG: LacI family DNA-binding transcriptional regulator [Kouleothrix sp.]|jgi:LacI family transcriptional regulator/LacI family repressor for deo operon, udp, cdd, tsx, nupC, and nupG|nr:LacI family DNA-binding transcriptional regulator [Kouleothrix sp.]
MAATIKQVAELAEVSTATVSYVLNGTGTVTDATRQRVLGAIAQLNYQPSHAARSMRGRSYTLGLTLPAQPGRLADPALAELLAGLTDAAAMRGYFVLLATVGDQNEVELCLQLARTGRVDGVLLLDMLVDDERARGLCAAKVAHVCAGPPPSACPSPFVMVDGRAGALAAVRHLLGLGHRRIGLIQLPSELAESEPRYQGYADALTEAGIAPDPALIVEAGRTEEDGYQAIGELLAAPQPPTAVLACNDELAFGAMHALYDAGLEVGRDISIIGFDDLPLATHTHPPLTALRQPRRAVGEHLAALLIDTIEQRARAAQSTTLSPRLIIRRSTGPARV